MRSLTLTLPLPPSPNRWAKHPIAQQREKDRYRAEAWVTAYQQVIPPLDPPERVTVDVTLYLPRKRDNDNAWASCKWVLDALRQHQQGAMRWRNGLGESRGYFVDDDPERCELVVRQVTDRKVPRVRVLVTERAA